MEAPDAGTVVLTLANPDPAILAKLVFGAFGVVNQKQVEEQGGTAAADAATTDKAEEWLNSNSAGSGPYMLEKWEPGVETVLVRNPNFWGEPAKMERVIFRNVAEAATQKIQLEAGDIDIAMDLTADQVPSLKENQNVAVYEDLSSTLIFLKANQDPEVGGPLSDPKVQQAIRYASRLRRHPRPGRRPVGHASVHAARRVPRRQGGQLRHPARRGEGQGPAGRGRLWRRPGYRPGLP